MRKNEKKQQLFELPKNKCIITGFPLHEHSKFGPWKSPIKTIKITRNRVSTTAA